MDLDDYKRLLEALQKFIQMKNDQIERIDFFENFNLDSKPKITSNYLHNLLNLNEYKRTEEKLIKIIKKFEPVKE